jgi:hypothetical protein
VGNGLGGICQRFLEAGHQARLVVFRELLDVDAQRAVQLEQHRHGQRPLVLLQLVQVAGRQPQRVRQGDLRHAALGTQRTQTHAHECFLHACILR